MKETWRENLEKQIEEAGFRRQQEIGDNLTSEYFHKTGVGFQLEVRLSGDRCASFRVYDKDSFKSICEKFMLFEDKDTEDELCFKNAMAQVFRSFAEEWLARAQKAMATAMTGDL